MFAFHNPIGERAFLVHGNLPVGSSLHLTMFVAESATSKDEGSFLLDCCTFPCGKSCSYSYYSQRKIHLWIKIGVAHSDKKLPHHQNLRCQLSLQMRFNSSCPFNFDNSSLAIMKIMYLALMKKPIRAPICGSRPKQIQPVWD